MGGAALILLVAGWSPLGPAALAVLEDRFPPPYLEGKIDGAVLLGGAIDTHISARRSTQALNEAGERITAIAALGHRYPDMRVVLSGGAGHVRSVGLLTESEVARELLVGMGLDQARIEIEEESRDTCENAEMSLRAASPAPGERWLLVTSASHMPRAMGCFRAAGFPVTPFPVDYRTQGFVEVWHPSASIAKGLSALDLAAHEWIALAGYRALGRTSEFFPQS